MTLNKATIKTKDQQQLEKAISLFNQKKYHETLEVINTISKTNPIIYEKTSLIRAGIEIRQGKAEIGLELIKNLEEQIGGLNNPELINLKGIALRSMGRLKEAFETFEIGVKKFPKAIDLAHNLSLTAGDLAKYDLAIQLANEALKIDPNFKDTLKNLARMYITIRDTENAQKIFNRIKRLEKNSLDVLVGEGAIQLMMGETEKAKKLFEKALKINDRLGPAWANIGICYKFENNYEKAKEYLKKACEIEPQQIEHLWNLSLVQLAMGDYEEGWKNYEIRYDTRRIATDRVVLPQTPVPMLKNNDCVKDKRIVLLQEQGFGDTFQFLRFSKELKKEGAKEIVAIVGKELIDTIKTIPWIDRVQFEMRGEELPDYWTFPMSLPNRYNLKATIDIPTSIPYISAELKKVQYWEKKFEQLDPKKIKVGLVWAGRETHTNDKKRSLHLSELRQLSKLQDEIEFISLQKGEKENQDPGDSWKILKLGNEIQSFADTAAIYANLDLLISIDSAPIHLAGAMGMPVWSLIPTHFDFRWLINQIQSPWYPSMRLFRQKENNNWENVIENVRDELQKLIDNKNERWKAKIYEEHQSLAKNIAGENLYLQSAFQYHLENKYNIAKNLYETVLEINPKNIDAARNLASTYRSIGDIASAEKIYKYSEANEFRDSILFTNYARLLIQQNKIENALEKIRKALSIDKKNTEAKKLYEELIGTKLEEKSIENKNNFKKNIEVNSENSQMLSVLDDIKKSRLDEAKEKLLKLLVTSTNKIEYALIAAHLYQELEEYETALECYSSAENLDSKNPEIYINRGVLKAKMGDYEEAIKDVKKCIELSPNNAEAHFHLSIYLLSIGNYKDGWKEYEWRMDERRTAKERVIRPKLSMPMWQGESLTNKRILIMPEQGYGDNIQFLRYAKWLKSLGATTIATSHLPLTPILKDSDFIDEYVFENDIVHYHYWTFPMSLPFRAGTTIETIPNEIPYIYAQKEKIKEWNNWLNKNFKNCNKPLIGLCWRGDSKHLRDKNRSISLENFYEILEMNEYNFVGLDFQENSNEIYTWENGSIVNAGYKFKDFSDTAAVIHQLDLLISIDSAPVHLSGAMGKKTWLLLDSILPDFRWMLNREDTPWYPNTKIYRKKKNQNWLSLIKIIKNDLIKLTP